MGLGSTCCVLSMVQQSGMCLMMISLLPSTPDSTDFDRVHVLFVCTTVHGAGDRLPRGAGKRG